ncbi:DUF3168 domain-containing protein [Pontivivens nitratireducens]|uniref:DUF3168 domain-containing protein n=1 Tax=Pontivivens nitratireducens TaxID=2758038 RepID=A0A6G7VNA8_9RHOB|nr:DUF3168 domain-containing protein [Pontibrevibacter nitratireducens]QIK41345.1 DUF3168 domain-containing protein [Pontibrevibacter nitratireducens]
MSYAFSWPLQQGLYWALSAAPEITDLAEVLDATAVPTSNEYVSIGEEKVRERGPDLTQHDIVIEVHSAAQGFSRAKLVAAEVGRILLHTPPAVTGATVTDLRFLKARARRSRGTERRLITLTFRVLLDAN